MTEPRRPKPMPLWLPIVAAVCFLVAGFLAQDTFTRVLMLIAGACFAVTAVLQWRMRNRK